MQRKPFCIVVFLSYVVGIPLSFYLSTASNTLDSSVMMLGFYLCLACFSVLIIIATLKRLKDVNMNSAWLIVMFIIPLNFILFAYLCFKKNSSMQTFRATSPISSINPAPASHRKPSELPDMNAPTIEESEDKDSK